VRTRAAVALGSLAVATAVAGFVIQRIKDSPALLRLVQVTRAFSPNGDGHRDTATVRFKTGRGDAVSVTVLGPAGAPVRHLARDRHLARGQLLRVLWDGRTDAGAAAPNGSYRVRVTLRARDRTIELVPAIRLRGLRSETPTARRNG
jgi:hypothetical protein